MREIEGRDYVRWKVRERDKYTCQDCGVVRKKEDVEKYNSTLKTLLGRKKSLDVHHLKGMCGKKSRGYDKVEDMGILITLCHKCHFNRPEHKVQKENFGFRKLRKSDHSKIFLQRQKGQSFQKIANKYDVSAERIRQVVKKQFLSTPLA